MESLKEIMDNVLKPAGMAHLVRWKRSLNKFSGISSAITQSQGLVCFPIGLLGINRARYSADVVGGMSGRCPGLVPLITLLSQGCLISCGYFSNNDGLLGIRTPFGFCAQRLLLTDSGHYLMPISNFSMQRDVGMDKLLGHDYRLLDKAARKQRLDKTAKQQVNLLTGLATYLSEGEEGDEPPVFQPVLNKTVKCSAALAPTHFWRATLETTTGHGPS